MKSTNHISALNNELSELQKLLAIIEDRTTVLPIEADLLLDKLRRCYEMVLALKNSSNDSHPEVEKTAVKEERIDILEFTEESHTSNERIIVPHREEAERTNNLPGDKVYDEAEHMVPHMQTTAHKKERAGTIVEQYLGQKESLNDAFSKNPKQKDLVTRLQSKPIRSIASSIGINEKFLFTKSLFKGDATLYSKTIDALDNAPTFNDAYLYLTEHFNWDMEREDVQQILELVRRKFISLKNE